MKIEAIVCAAACLLAGAAQAQAVWRCGPDGRSYSDSPCAGGSVVAVADTRSADQRAASREVLSRDRVLARELAQERRERESEALARNALPAGIRHEARAELSPKARKKKQPAAAGTSPAAVRVSPRKTG